MNNSNNIKNWIKSFFIAIFIIIIIIVLVILLKYYVVDVVIVNGDSMIPTYGSGDKVYISRIFQLNEFKPKRGKVIVFEEPLINSAEISNENPIAKYNYQSNLGFWKSFKSIKNECIKRVIGLPGEHIEIKYGNIFINGKKIEENYLYSNTITQDKNLFNFIVPKNTVFVLGDNREYSIDSRNFGCIPFERIDGIAY